MKRSVFIAILPLVFLAGLHQAHAFCVPNSPDAFNPGMDTDKSHEFSAMIGLSKFDEDMYVDLLLGLELNFDLVGIGLAVPLHTLAWDRDPENTDAWYHKYLFRKADWDEVSDYFRIFRYIRYGCKGCEENWVYGILGDLQSVSIGHGTIVGSYANNYNQSHYQLGLQADVYTPWAGMELLLNNVINPHLFGARVYLKPVSFYDKESYWNGLKVAMTVMSDITAPHTLQTTTDDNGDGLPDVTADKHNLPNVDGENALTVYGWDLEFKVLDLDWLDLTPFLDVNYIGEHGAGMHLGVMADWEFGVTLNTRAEYRYFGDEYLPTYFNNYYEAERFLFAGSASDTKQQALNGVKGRHGYYLGASIFFLDVVRIGATFDDYQGANNSNLLVFIDIPALEFLEFSAYYYKSNFDKAKDIVTFDDRSLFVAQAVIRYNIMRIGLHFTRSWTFDQDKGKYEPHDDYGFTAGVGVQF